MICYRITNNLNDHRYIGISRKYSAEERFKQHCNDARKGAKNRLHRAMRKYGVENFSVEIVCHGISRRDLASMEKDYIADEKPEYNMTIGGEGVVGLCKESIALANITRRKTRANWTKQQLAEIKSTMRTAQLGVADTHRFNCKNWWANATPEQRTKRLAGMLKSPRAKGYKHSTECRKKMSDSHNARLLRLAIEAVERANA